MAVNTFSLSDYFTKWVDAIPTVVKFASTVPMVLFKVLCICISTCIDVLFSHRSS